LRPHETYAFVKRLTSEEIFAIRSMLFLAASLQLPATEERNKRKSNNPVDCSLSLSYAFLACFLFVCLFVSVNFFFRLKKKGIWNRPLHSHMEGIPALSFSSPSSLVSY